MGAGIFYFRKTKGMSECEWCFAALPQDQAVCSQCGTHLNPVFQAETSGDGIKVSNPSLKSPSEQMGRSEPAAQEDQVPQTVLLEPEKKNFPHFSPIGTPMVMGVKEPENRKNGLQQFLQKSSEFFQQGPWLQIQRGALLDRWTQIQPQFKKMAPGIGLLLLLIGLSVKMPDHSKKTIPGGLTEAAAKGNLTEVQEKIKTVPANDPNKEAQKALVAAIVAGHSSVVDYLLRQGVDPSPVEYGHGVQNPLLASIENGYTDMVELLLQYGALLYAKEGAALVLAAGSGQIETVALLISRKASVDAKSSSTGKTPLISAAERGHAHVVSYLLEQGADMNLLDVRGNTALSLAQKHHHGQVVQILQGYRPHPASSGIPVPNSDLGVVGNSPAGATTGNPPADPARNSPHP